MKAVAANRSPTTPGPESLRRDATAADEAGAREEAQVQTEARTRPQALAAGREPHVLEIAGQRRRRALDPRLPRRAADPLERTRRRPVQLERHPGYPTFIQTPHRSVAPVDDFVRFQRRRFPLFPGDRQADAPRTPRRTQSEPPAAGPVRLTVVLAVQQRGQRRDHPRTGLPRRRFRGPLDVAGELQPDRTGQGRREATRQLPAVPAQSVTRGDLGTDAARVIPAQRGTEVKPLGAPQTQHG